MPDLNPKTLRKRALTTPPLDLRRFVDRAVRLREDALAARWNRVSTVSRAASQQARRAMDRVAPSLAAIAHIQTDPSLRVYGPLGSWSKLRDRLSIQLDRLTFDYSLHLSLLVDSLLAASHADFNKALVEGPGRPDAGAAAAMATSLGTYVTDALKKMHRAFRSKDWTTAGETAGGVMEEVPDKVAAATRLLAALHGAGEEPYAGSSQSARLSYARAALKLHASRRELMFLFAAAGYLQFHASRAAITGSVPTRVVPDASLSFASKVDFGDRVNLGTLIASPSAFNDSRITSEGVVRSLRFSRAGRKFSTFLEIAPDFREDAPIAMLRTHFHDLREQGLCVGQLLRFTGRAQTSAPWSDGDPAIELATADLSDSSSWLDRLRVIVRPWYDAYPNGVLVQWTLAAQPRIPTGASSKPGGADEIIRRRLFRVG